MSQVMDNVKAACTRGLVLAPVAALLLSVAILLLGNGLLGTLLIVRAGQEGFSAAAIAYSDEAGRVFRREAGQAFQFDAGHCSDLKPNAASCLWV